MILIDQPGDLFSSTDSKAHAISADCRLGKGIALEFRRLYGQVHNIKHQRKTVGEVAYFQHKPGEYIFNLVTKEKYWHKPTYDTLKTCLEELALICDSLTLKNLSLPRIGCGLDCLEYTRVREIIKEVFRSKDMIIRVYTQ